MFTDPDESGGFDSHTHYQTIKGICQGLHYLHDDCICHLDLNPANILLRIWWENGAKTIALWFFKSHQSRRRLTGFKSRWVDGLVTPEYLAGREITLKSEVYTLVVLIMQIVSGKKKLEHTKYTWKLEKYVEVGLTEGSHIQKMLPASKSMHWVTETLHVPWPGEQTDWAGCPDTHAPLQGFVFI